jgi:hypothetical protein
MDYHFRELKRGGSISVHLEGKVLILEKVVRHIAVLVLLIELVMLCYTHFMGRQ